MSMMPDTRAEMVEPMFKGTKGSFEPYPNPYYEGNLSEENKERIKEYDFAIEDAKQAILNASDGDWMPEIDVRPSDILLVMQAFQEYFEEDMESRRNDYVISMIESQEDEEDG